MQKKLEFYEQYGVQEYYIYDPDHITLKGYGRQNNTLVPISEINGWVSPRLKIRFVLNEEDLEIYRPNGRKFLSFLEVDERAKLAEFQAEQERLRAEQEKLRAEQETQRATTAEERALAAEELLAQYRDRFGSLDDMTIE